MPPFLGFLEVLIWIVVVSRLVIYARTPLAFLGYAAGFALGKRVVRHRLRHCTGYPAEKG
ncbi:MAG: hypothetical protein H5U36_07125 [Candidatus Caldatribacterium sp.]|nr:hypothetical protein [Candidatus Caldatribacterium sp.]